MNKPKAKGTAAETALLRWLRANGFPWAERLALAGAADCGDISLLPGRAVVLEVKAHATAGRGIPQDGQLAEWMAQAAAERDNAGADLCPLILRRSGQGAGDPGKWWAWLTFADVTALTGAPIHLAEPLAPICMSVASLTALLRAAGYGHRLEAVS
jgi:hypothetical protein